MNSLSKPLATPIQQPSAQSVLAHYGKSFYWAGQLLRRDTLRDAALLYAFCREVDDAVDLAPTPEAARDALGQIRQALATGHAQSLAVNGYLQLARRHSLSDHWAEALLQGIGSDIPGVSGKQTVRVGDQQQLLQYCYRVAGTVGAMMCPLLGITDPRATPFAIDLGIAMQLTNIARDVHEDATRNRVYLPLSYLSAPVNPAALCDGDTKQRQQAQTALLRLLDLADIYYRSAEQGMRFIPLRNRLAILTAARLYRAIGHKIRRDPGQIWRRRVVVSPRQKALCTLGAGIAVVMRPALLGLGQRQAHQSRLHAALSGILPSDAPDDGGR